MEGCTEGARVHGEQSEQGENNLQRRLGEIKYEDGQFEMRT